MKNIFTLLCLLMFCFCKGQNSSKKPVQEINTKEIEQKLNPIENLLISVQESPVDFDINENGIILLSYIAEKNDNNDIIVNYKLHMYTLQGEELNSKIIYTEKNKSNIINPNEKIELKYVRIVNDKYLVIGNKMLNEEFDLDYYFMSFNKDLMVLNAKSISIPEWQTIQSVQENDSRIFMLSISPEQLSPKNNDLFKVNQKISILNDKLDNFEETSLSLSNLTIPTDFDSTITNVECASLTVDSENYYLLCKAQRKNELHSPFLISINRISKSINWSLLIGDINDDRLFFPENPFTLNESMIAFSCLQKGITSIIVVNKNGQFNSQYMTNKFDIPYSIHSIKNGFMLGGSMSIDEDVISNYNNLSKNLLGNKTFVNYAVSIDHNSKYLTESFWAKENAESILRTKKYDGTSYFLCRAFISWPGKKYTKIYKLNKN